MTTLFSFCNFTDDLLWELAGDRPHATLALATCSCLVKAPRRVRATWASCPAPHCLVELAGRCLNTRAAASPQRASLAPDPAWFLSLLTVSRKLQGHPNSALPGTWPPLTNSVGLLRPPGQKASKCSRTKNQALRPMHAPVLRWQRPVDL